MHEIDINGLQQLIEKGKLAKQYALDHYEELVARKHTYTLFGPYTYGIGASRPTKPTPKHARKLQRSTRRKDFLVYELDENYKVLRTKAVINHSYIDCIYHHFEMGGITYAYPFDGTTKKVFTDTVSAIKFLNNKPIFYAETGENSMFAQFYEYISPEKMVFTEYWYTPTSRYSLQGYSTDPSAPVGALNSPAARICTEETPEYIDFSRWFNT